MIRRIQKSIQVGRPTKYLILEFDDYLMEFIENLEEALGKKAIKNFVPFQLGDVKSTFADTTLLEKWINYKPNTSIKEGIFKFVDWFRYYYNS